MGTTLVRRSFVAIGLAAMAAASAAAQVAPNPPRIVVALAGCWTPAGIGVTTPTTCVVPGADGNSLRLIPVGAAAEAIETVLQLDGERTPFEAGGCTGWQSARASSDGERILIASEVRCGTSPLQKRSAIFSITPTGYWLRAEGSGIASIQNAQVQLLEHSTSILGVPADIRDAVAPIAEEAEALRASIQLTALTASDLIELERLGAAGPIIDVVVAAGNPKSFQLSVAGPLVAATVPGDDVTEQSERRPDGFGRYGYGFGYPNMSEYEWAHLNGCYSMAYGLYDPRFCSFYSYNAFGYWNRNYGYGTYWTGGYYPPGTTVVINPIGRPESGGRVRRGQGYENTRSATPTGSGTPRTVQSHPSSTRSPSGTSSGSSTGSSTSTGSSSGSGTRTAQPRSP